jgi:glycosyltransferase involved in cell wall biosynthesis
VTQSDRWLNHRLTLPNRLFQAVAVGVPVVASDVGELAATVRRHRLGTLYRPGDPQSLVAAAREAVRTYPELLATVGAAASELSWERDAQALLAVYATLADGRAGSASGAADGPPR